MKKFAIALMSTFLMASAQAVELPTTQEVKKVLDFYYNGQGMGVVLIDAKLCRDVHREGDEKNECAGDVTSEAITKGDTVNLWMSFMVPMGDEKQKILVQFDQGGVTRSVKNMTVTGSLRYRTWRKVTLDRVGVWNIKIVHDRDEGAAVLGEVSATVQ